MRQFHACADMPLGTDWPQHLHIGWGRRRNQQCQISWQSVKGFRSCQTPKTAFPIENVHRPYNSVGSRHGATLWFNYNTTDGTEHKLSVDLDCPPTWLYMYSGCTTQHFICKQYIVETWFDELSHCGSWYRRITNMSLCLRHINAIQLLYSFK